MELSRKFSCCLLNRLDAQREGTVIGWLTFVACIFLIPLVDFHHHYPLLACALIASLLLLIGAVMGNHLLILPWLYTFLLITVGFGIHAVFGLLWGVIVFLPLSVAICLWLIVFYCYTTFRVQKESQQSLNLNEGSINGSQNLKTARAPKLV